MLLNDLVWFLYLVLKLSAVTPMYFTGVLVWYTTLFVRRLPSAGHLLVCQQLHCRVSSVLVMFVCVVCLFSIFLLCLFMNEVMLSRQL